MIQEPAPAPPESGARRLALFGSDNAGLYRDAPTTFFPLGFARAL